MSIDIKQFSIAPLGEGAGDASMTAREMLNNRIGIIEDDLNNLVSRISQTTGKSAIIRQYVPLSADAFTGALVYFDKENLVFAPALAKLLGIPGDQGQSIEADCARVEGIVLSTYTDNSNNIVGTSLTGGFWQDDVALGCPVVQGLFGAVDSDDESVALGTYYLSATNAGMATQDPGIHLRQPILTYYGNGAFSLNIFYMAHDNHFHGSRLLSNNWTAVSEILPPDVDASQVPEHAMYWYDGSGDIYYTGIGELSSDTTAIFYNGVLEYTTDKFIVQSGYIWYKGVVPPAADTVSVFNHYPFAYGSPVIRSVESGNTALRVNTSNGRVILRANDFVSGSVTNNAVAVSAITGNTVQFTPVVSGLAAGPGIKLDTAVNGVTTISSAENINVPIDAYNIFHKGTNIVCDNAYIYVSFPAGRTSSCIMSLPLRNIAATATLRAYAYCYGIGSGAFTVSFFWSNQPTPGEQTTLNKTSIRNTSLSFSGNANSLVYAETPEAAEITGSGQLVASIAVNGAPNTEIRMLSIGFRLEVAHSAVETASVTDVTNVNAVINSMAAGATIGRFKCIKAVNGMLEVCTSSSAENVNQCIGISIDEGIQGDAVRYLIQGVIESEDFAFTAGAPIFIGPTGNITEVNPANDDNAAYIRRIGTALTPSIVQIVLEPGIIKEQL